MEKEKLSSDLKGLVGENSLSQRTWDDYIDNSVLPFLPVEDDKRSEFLAKQATVLKSLNGQFNHDVATKVNEAKKAIVPPTQTPPTPIQTVEITPPNNEATALAGLEKRLNDIEKAKALEVEVANKTKILSNVTAKAKELGADQSDLLEMVIGSTPLAENVMEDDYLKLIKAKYDEKYSKIYGEGVRPAYGGSLSVKPTGKMSPEAKKVKDKMIEERKQLRV